MAWSTSTNQRSTLRKGVPPVQPVSRPSRDEVFLDIAAQLARRSTCSRRQVGCVLIDLRGHVLATGYNGVPSNWDHCTLRPCPGAGLPSGVGLEKCEAIHAEQNALLQCRDVYLIDTAYCTHSPCLHCVKLLLNTSCRRIVFTTQYTHSMSEELWRRRDESKEWVHAKT